VIAVDTNVLVYAYRKESPFHSPSIRLMKQLVEGQAPWAIAWPSVHEFISVTTNPKIFKTQNRIEDAFNQIAIWQGAGRLRFLAESHAHMETLQELLIAGQARGVQFHDARIATICLQHGVTELWTADRDFSRFPKLKTRNPLVG
jgi:uncharacterized protein